MNPVSFLLIALVVGVGGCLLVVAVNRAPQRGDSAMRDFEREMQALAPRSDVEEPRRQDGPRSGITIDGGRRAEVAGPEGGTVSDDPGRDLDDDPGSGRGDRPGRSERPPTSHPHPDAGRGDA